MVANGRSNRPRLVRMSTVTGIMAAPGTRPSRTAEPGRRVLAHMRLNLQIFWRFIATVPITATLVAGAVSADDFLPMKEAYRYTASASPTELVVQYRIADGYYLYRDRLAFEGGTPDVRLGAPIFPEGEVHEDEYFGKQTIFRKQAAITVPVDFGGRPREFDLKLKLQGCADAGLCYPPTTWTTRVAVVSPKTVAAGPEPAAASGLDLRTLAREGSGSGEDRFLKADRAFVFAAESQHPDRVQLDWEIADGYYLYRDKITVRSLSPEVGLGSPSLPAGEDHEDEYFGKQTVYRGLLEVALPLSHAASVREVPLEIGYQGCADEGLCYPPITKQVTVRLAPVASAAAASADAGSPAVSSASGKPPAGVDAPRSEQDSLADRIRAGNLLTMLLFFFAIGLGLAFTPCVLPMVPIVSGIIVGAGRDAPVSRGRAFSLSLAYVLGMACTYTLAGIAFAAAGQQAQAYFQKPWMIAGFAALFVVLALSMFGLFTVQVPAAFQSRIAALSDRQKQGTLTGTAVIGALSALIVTACVAPALVASLAVIGEGGHILRGGLALFAMSFGMGTPLLVVGASAGELLPRAGAWMDVVKAGFGVLLLGVAIWMLSRILPGPVTLALWAALAFVTGYCLMALGGRDARSGFGAVRRGAGALAAVYGVLLLIGALSGRSSPLQPLAGLGGTGSAATTTQTATPFKGVKTVADLEREVAAAAASGRPAMLDFYADWCVSCKEMEHYTFPDPGVQAELARAVLLQADVTANDAEDQALLQHFDILGPPSILFFDASGVERPEFRVVGFKPADEFRAHLRQAFGIDVP
jgi:thiol:disulfide interchange protein DsbD